MVESSVIVSGAGFVASIITIFTSAALYMSKTAEVSAACGSGLWDLTLAMLILHPLLIFIAMVCVILPISHLNDSMKEGVEASKSVFMGYLITLLLLLVGVFGTEVYYASDALANANCELALKAASKVDHPILTTALIIFIAIDAVVIIMVIILLSCTSCIFDAYDRIGPDQGQTSAQLSRPNDRLLDVEIDLGM